MSKRTSIVKALVEKLKLLDGTGNYSSNIYGNAYSTLKFWDEVNNFPSIYVTPGVESREYHPSSFAWGYLNVSIKVYTKGENSPAQLETLLDDIETLLYNHRTLQYDVSGDQVTDMYITSIVTDDGLLYPYSIAEINLQVRYQIMY